MRRTIAVAIFATFIATPCRADALPPGFEPVRSSGPVEKLAPGDPLGYRPAVPTPTPGEVSRYRTFDPPMRWAAPSPALPWNGAPRGFVMPATALGRWDGTPAPPPGLPPGWDRPITSSPRPLAPGPGDAVPGPLPLLGVGAMIHVSRRLRRRIAK